MMDLHEVHNDSKFDQLTASILIGIVTLRFESVTILLLILTQYLMIKVKCCFEKIQEYLATVTSSEYWSLVLIPHFISSESIDSYFLVYLTSMSSIDIMPIT